MSFYSKKSFTKYNDVTYIKYRLFYNILKRKVCKNHKKNKSVKLFMFEQVKI